MVGVAGSSLTFRSGARLLFQLREAERSLILFLTGMGMARVLSGLVGLFLVACALSPTAGADASASDGAQAFRIMTYNILRPDDSTAGRISALVRREGAPADRAEAILRLIQQRDPDIIALQEVTPTFVKALTSSPWLSQYELVHTLAPAQLSATYHLQEPDGMAVLSKWPLELIADNALIPSKLRRRMLVVDIQIDDAPVRVGVCHLDSFEQDGTIRARQLAAFFRALAAAENAILLGDFNFGDGQQPETAALDPAYSDTWLALRPGEPGATFGGPAGVRLDRILVRAARWVATDIGLVGTEPIAIGGTHRYASDHYGVLATLRRR